MRRRKEEAGSFSEDQNPDASTSTKDKTKQRRASLPIPVSENPYRKEYKTRSRERPYRSIGASTQIASATHQNLDEAESLSAPNSRRNTAEAEGDLKMKFIPSSSTQPLAPAWIRKHSTYSGGSTIPSESPTKLREGMFEEAKSLVPKESGPTLTVRPKSKSKVSKTRPKYKLTSKRQPAVKPASKRQTRKFHDGVPTNSVEEDEMCEDFKNFLRFDFLKVMMAAHERKAAAGASGYIKYLERQESDSKEADPMMNMKPCGTKKAGDGVGSGYYFHDADSKDSSCTKMLSRSESHDKGEPVAGPSWKIPGDTRTNKDQQGQTVGPSGLPGPGFRIYNEDLDVLSNEDSEVSLYPVIYNDEVHVAVPRASGEVLLVPGCLPWVESGLLNGDIDLRILKQGMPMLPQKCVDKDIGTNDRIF